MPSRAMAFLMALAGWLCSVESGPATTPCAPISASQLSPSSVALALLITTTAAAPSEICEAEPAVMVPSLRNAGRSPPRGLRGGVGADALVLGELDRVALALWDLHRHHLIGEDAVLPRRRGLLVRLRGQLILLGPGELIDIVALLGQRAHRLIGEHIVQAVVGQVIHQRGVAVLEASTALGQQMRGLAHRFLAAGHHHLELPGADQLIGQRDGIDPGQAHLVDGQRRHIPADPGADGGLARGHLPGTGGQHLTHDHVVDQRAPGPGLSPVPP